MEYRDILLCLAPIFDCATGAKDSEQQKKHVCMRLLVPRIALHVTEGVRVPFDCGEGSEQ